MPWKSSPDALSLLAQARRSVRTAHTLLLHPTVEALRDAQPHFEQALKAVAAIGSAPRGAAAEAERLRTEVGRAAALLEGVAAFHFGWAQVLRAAGAGYTADGGAAEPAPLRSVSAEG